MENEEIAKGHIFTNDWKIFYPLLFFFSCSFYFTLSYFHRDNEALFSEEHFMSSEIMEKERKGMYLILRQSFPYLYTITRSFQLKEYKYENDINWYANIITKVIANVCVPMCIRNITILVKSVPAWKPTLILPKQMSWFDTKN